MTLHEFKLCIADIESDPERDGYLLRFWLEGGHTVHGAWEPVRDGGGAMLVKVHPVSSGDKPPVYVAISSIVGMVLANV